MAQSVERLTFDSCSGHDPRAVGSSTVSGSVLGVRLLGIPSLSLCPSPTHAAFLSVSKKRRECLGDVVSEEDNCQSMRS